MALPSLIRQIDSAGLLGFLPATLIASVLIAVTVIVLAFIDRRLLLKAGQPTAASGFWILLTPIAYLAARASHTKRHTGRGWQPFWTYISLLAVYMVFYFADTISIAIAAL